MRKGRQQVEFAAPIGRTHLTPELAGECSPRPLIRGCQRFVNQFGAGLTASGTF